MVVQAAYAFGDEGKRLCLVRKVRMRAEKAQPHGPAPFSGDAAIAQQVQDLVAAQRTRPVLAAVFAAAPAAVEADDFRAEESGGHFISLMEDYCSSLKDGCQGRKSKGTAGIVPAIIEAGGYRVM